MALKRKRSDSEFSSPMTTSSASSIQMERDTSSSPTPFPQESRYNLDGFDHSMEDFRRLPNGTGVMEITPQHLSSRTRKRFRNSRPDDSVVHAHTLNLLYNAQKPTAPVPVLSQDSRPQRSGHRSSSAPQPTLHSFWNLPYRTNTNFTAMSEENTPLPRACCEDCDGHLPYAASNQDAMDIEGLDDYGCLECKRQVCDICAVSADEGRVCLQCERSGFGRKKWVGGLGWM